MVGASKRFNDLLTYHFTLSTSVTFDGGQSWIEGAKLKLLDDWGEVFYIFIFNSQSFSIRGIAFFP